MRISSLILSVLSSFSVFAQQPDTLLSGVYSWNTLNPEKEDTRVRRQVLEGKTFALSDLEIHASTLEPGKAPHPPHTHNDQDELIIVKDGQVKITIAGKSKTLGAGSIAFAMANDEHGIENAGKTNATYYILKYRGRYPTNVERSTQAGGSFMIDRNELKTTNTGKGYRRDFFNRPTSQLNQFEMHTTALNSDSISHAPHTHVQEEVILILRGNVEMFIDGKYYKGSEGDIFFLSSGILHNLKNVGKDQCEYFAFQWRN
jgi:(S)-ureidoglycine aminohydrolase